MQFPPFAVELLLSLGGVTSEGYTDQVTSTVREVDGFVELYDRDAGQETHEDGQ